MVRIDELKNSPTDPRILTLGSPSSALEFTRAAGGDWPQWDRFLTLDGKPAYHLGNVCNTCEFFFERLSGATHSLSAEQLGAALADGQPPMERSWIEALGTLLPTGDYIPFYTRAPVKLVRPGEPGDYFAHEQLSTWGVDPFWRLPHDPRTEYYRGRVVPLSPLKIGNRAIFEFVVPMFPHEWLDEERVREYGARVAKDPPAALAISVLDVKGPADWQTEPAVVEHWCLAHYLLDGHHKTYAAAVSDTVIGMLSFLAVNESIAAPEQALDVVRQLASQVVA